MTWEELEKACLNCRGCQLSETRHNVVIGVGNKNSDIMFVGEGPGYNEDMQGEPFVGAAGQLLDKMLHAINLDRKDVYIANVVKCRPPNNRDPLPYEQEITGSTGATATAQNGQFSVNASSISSNSLITFSTAFINGTTISAASTTAINLSAGHVYQVSFLVKASVTVAGAIGVTPQLNGVSQTGFATSANAALTAPTVSVSGTFLVNTLISADVQVSFLYTSSLLANSPSGVFSILQIQ